MKNLKKVLSGILVAMLFSTSISAYAVETVNVKDEYNPNNIRLDDCTGINLEEYAEANEELIQLGKMAQKTKARKILTVKHYYQDDPSWSKDIMKSCNQTIGTAGCTLTSFAMIANYYGCMNDDPDQVNTVMGSNACPFMYYVAAERYGLSVANAIHRDVSDSDAIDFIIGGISANRPVLVGMQKDYSSNTHFVLAYGYDGSTIYIHDPASNRDYTTLGQYLSGYSVNRLYIYSR